MLIRQIISLPEYDAGSDRETKRVHKDLLQLYFEAQVRANMVYLTLNPSAPNLYASGVVYSREGRPELWLDIPAILDRGHDDCEGLSTWLAAELRVREKNSLGTGKRPAATVRLKRTRTRGLWHAQVVDLATGEIFDPSRRLGMGKAT